MTTHADRLVQRVQRELQSIPPAALPGRVASGLIAELTARISRLQGMGACFGHVQLSDHLTGCEMSSFVRFLAIQLWNV
jgi:hypothetical protein